MRFPIDQIWIDENAVDEPLTGTVLDRLPGVQVLVGPRAREEHRRLVLTADPLSRGKRILHLRRHEGAFVKPCPGTTEYVCCGLEILHIGQGCPMDCRYCALQAYFNRPVLEVFVNIDEMKTALQGHLAENPDHFHRICTGEFTDSLALDPVTGLASTLVEAFSDCANGSLELKTKTDHVEPLLDLSPNGRVVVSFSVNAEAFCRAEEHRAASLQRRITAAVRLQARGYAIGLHFDPIVPLSGWQDAYGEVVDSIFRKLEPSSIAWISLGVLRFVPPLKEAATARFGFVRYFHDAFQRGLDGKSRLNVERRIEIYRHMADRIRDYDPDTRLYLCMESPYVWKKALGVSMASDAALATYLDEAFGGSRSSGSKNRE